MVDNNNILLVTDFEETAKSILEKLVLLRENDNITVCNSKNIKRILEKSLYSVVILHESDNETSTIKLIENIKTTKQDIEILLLLNKEDRDLILKAYDAGIFDYFTIDSEDYDILIKTINCFKIRTMKEIESRNDKFLNQLGVIDPKTNLYKYKYLKEIFIDLSDDLRIQNGTLSIVTLDESTKTKISTNRLGLAIKNCVRNDDIVAVHRGGNYYIIIPNINIEGTKDVIIKIQAKMGTDFKLRAGISTIGLQSFETIDKNAQDSLTASIQNDEMATSIECIADNTNAWLEDGENPQAQKNFKLFTNIFNSKLNNIITPVFYRQEKELETKLTNTEVSQYANNIESVFSLKNEALHSELTIRYNGHAKFNIEITHSGLDSAENTKINIPLKDLTEKYLLSLFKKLKDEYKKTTYRKEE